MRERRIRRIGNFRVREAIVEDGFDTRYRDRKTADVASGAG
jgi:hypothetical protein